MGELTCPHLGAQEVLCWQQNSSHQHTLLPVVLVDLHTAAERLHQLSREQWVGQLS